MSTMWGYQELYHASVQSEADEIFARLDENLQPSVFLIGVRTAEGDSPLIYLEPEGCGYDPARFAEVKVQAERLVDVTRAKPSIHGHPLSEEQHLQRRRMKALSRAVHQALSYDDEGRGVASFCARPMLVEGYHVIVALQFARKAYLSHYSLLQPNHDTLHFAKSLIDATVTEYLELCVDALQKPSPGASIDVIDRDYDEVIRAAGKRLMHTPAFAAREVEGMQGLYEACNTISSMRYEGSEGTGRMVVARSGHPNVEVAVMLARPVGIRDYRSVRKLLEMSSENMGLLSDGGYIYGLGGTAGAYDESAEDLFSIRFVKHYTWELLHAHNLMMRVSYGQPELPKLRLQHHKFQAHVSRIFPNITSREVARLWELTWEAIDQKRGTMVVVSAGAREEARRLEHQATLVEPIQLIPDVVRLVTAIDGAVLIDPSATCYAIGVILDGLASRHGDPGRGARYNSAIRYVETSNFPCLAIVVSEDGAVDLVPESRS
jgi:hypothetical protein